LRSGEGIDKTWFAPFCRVLLSHKLTLRSLKVKAATVPNSNITKRIMCARYKVVRLHKGNRSISYFTGVIMFKRVAIMALAVLCCIVLAAPLHAASYTVYVGYADGLRANGFFPSIWQGDAGVTFIGNSPGNAYDAGAIMIRNTGSTSLVVNSVSALINGAVATTTNGTHPDWTTTYLPITLGVGDYLILTQTNDYNFDSSDTSYISGASHATPCLGLPTDPPACATTFPTVTIGVDGGSAVTYNDTGHVLDTEGFDFALDGSNESHQWRPIGTVGGQSVPEPSVLYGLGFGILGLAGLRRHRRNQR
jgi:hypothetical protein